MPTRWATPLGWTLITVGQILLVVIGVLLSLAFNLVGDALRDELDPTLQGRS